ncbi:MAG: hypothetical protein VR77_04170 [Flavobacteriales bacterium BRH_c54]|nr:MAG: hypothetical protein VR77_04170 [Flavobacteriales bacterium BRH_c54]
MLPLVFTVKVAVALVFFLLYTFYYQDRSTADIFKFFDDSVVLFQLFHESSLDFFRLIFGGETSFIQEAYINKLNFWVNSDPNELYNDSRLMIKLNALLHFVSFGYYGVHLIVFTFLSFVGFTFLYKAFERFFEHKKLLLLVLFFVPSVLFWSTGVSKESILFFGLGLFLYAYFKLIHVFQSVKYIFLLLLSILIMLSIKPYIFLLIIPALLIYFIIEKYQWKRVLLSYVLGYFFIVLIGISVGELFPKYKLINQIATKQNNFINMAQGGVYMYDDKGEIRVPYENKASIFFINDTLCKLPKNTLIEFREKGSNNFVPIIYNDDTTVFKVTFNHPASGSLIHTNKLDGDIVSFTLHVPKALYYAMFKPFLFSSRNPLLLISGIENFFILLMLIVAILFRKKQFNSNLVAFGFTSTLLILVFVGITTPVMGAIVRYKIPALVLLMISVLALVDINRFKINTHYSLYSKYLS